MSAQYDSILQKAGRLSQAEKLFLISQLVEQLCAQVSPGAPVSILELEGLGKELWRGMDAQEYVDRERSSWNG